MNNDRRLDVRCNCGCSFLVLEAWDVDRPEAEWFAEVYKRPSRPHWRWRLKTAVGLLFGKEPVIDDLCFGPVEITEIRDFLNDTYPPQDEKTSFGDSAKALNKLNRREAL